MHSTKCSGETRLSPACNELIMSLEASLLLLSLSLLTIFVIINYYRYHHHYHFLLIFIITVIIIFIVNVNMTKLAVCRLWRCILSQGGCWACWQSVSSAVTHCPGCASTSLASARPPLLLCCGSWPSRLRQHCLLPPIECRQHLFCVLVCAVVLCVLDCAVLLCAVVL